MKRKIAKHLLIISVLSGVFMLSLTQLAVARKLPPPVKYIVYTRCCVDGQTSGYSNDCDEGEGSCVNHSCSSGTETQAPNCL